MCSPGPPMVRSTRFVFTLTPAPRQHREGEEDEGWKSVFRNDRKSTRHCMVVFLHFGFIFFHFLWFCFNLNPWRVGDWRLERGKAVGVTMHGKSRAGPWSGFGVFPLRKWKTETQCVCVMSNPPKCLLPNFGTPTSRHHPFGSGSLKSLELHFCRVGEKR